MSSTLIDRAGLAGDATQALDRQGVDSALITLIGGTSGTAVKLQTCDTATGSFTDILTLADGASDLYAGVAVDLRECERYIKVTGATMAIAVFGDMNYNVKDLTVKTGEIPSGDVTVEDNKTATIDVSAYTEPVEVEPTDGNDAMAKVTVTLSNIPVAGATLYAWKDASDNIAYTTSETPEAEGACYLAATTGLASDTIKTVADDTITVTVSETDTDYTRYSTGDITL